MSDDNWYRDDDGRPREYKDGEWTDRFALVLRFVAPLLYVTAAAAFVGSIVCLFLRKWKLAGYLFAVVLAVTPFAAAGT